MVVDGRDGDVDLGGPRSVRYLGRSANELEALDQVPPRLVELPLGVGVQVPLEVHHHQSPSSELQTLSGSRAIQVALQRRDRRVV